MKITLTFEEIHLETAREILHDLRKNHGRGDEVKTLSVRTRKAIQRLAPNGIDDIISRSADDWLNMRNFGVTALDELRRWLWDNYHKKLKGE